MTPRRDYDGSWVIPGFEECRFSSEEDADAACDLAIAFAAEKAVEEYRYRRAAKAAKEKA